MSVMLNIKPVGEGVENLMKTGRGPLNLFG